MRVERTIARRKGEDLSSKRGVVMGVERGYAGNWIVAGVV